ncbi:hypothetical protein [Amycolatopsis sp. NPDC054798]
MSGFPSAEGNSSPPAPADLLATARRVASANDEADPSDVRCVKTDRYTLRHLDGTRPTSNDPVYLIQLTGNFVGYAAKIPLGSKPPRGNALTVTVDANSGQMLGWSILLEPHDLAEFGEVFSLRQTQ